MIGLSAIVATYNRKKELERLLHSFVVNKYESLAEVIIVDQNKDHLIDDLIKVYRTQLTIKHLKCNEPNQSKARNFGASQAEFTK